MRKNNKITALIMAGALAVSNLGALAIPMTALAAVATNTVVATTLPEVTGSTIAANSDAAVGYALLGKATQFSLTISTTGGTTPLTDAELATIKAAIEGTLTAAAKNYITIDSISAITGGSTCKVTITIDGTNEKLADGDTVDINVDADTVYSVEFTDEETVSTASNLTFFELNTAGTKNVPISSTTKLSKGAVGDVVLTLGTRVGSIIDKIEATGLANGTAAGNNAKVINYTSSDESVLVVANQATNKLAPTFTAKKAGTVTVTATYKWDSDPTAAVKEETLTATCKVEVIPSSSDAELYVKAANGTLSAAPATITFDNKDTTSVNLYAQLINAAISNLAQDIVWICEDDSVIKLSSTSGSEISVSATGNTTAGVRVAMVDANGAAYKAYKESTKTAKLAFADLVTAIGAQVATTDLEGVITTFKAKAYTNELKISEENLNVVVGKTGTVDLTTNNTELLPGTSASETTIVYTITPKDESIATASVDKTTGVVTVKGVKAGKTTVSIEGVYKASDSNGVLVDTKLTGQFNVNVIDPESATDELTKAQNAQKAAEAEAATQKAAADAAKADAAAQKTAAKEAAAKAATAQKAAEDAAAAAEKKAADAAAAATGIKKGATKAVKGQTFKATSSKAVTLTKIKNAKTVTVGSVVEINNQVYKVTALGKGALKAGKATKLTVDAQFLTKKGINADCAKGTGKIKTLVVKNQTKKAAPAKALVKAVKKYNKKVKVQYK